MAPQEERFKARLESIGIQVTEHPVENDAFLKEIELRYAFVRVRSRQYDEALLVLVEELLKYVPVEKAEATQEKPETSYLDDPTRVEPGWLGETYDEGQKIAEYNRQMDERNRIIRESIVKPWLPLHDGE